jgi:hypothetical protein
MRYIKFRGKTSDTDEWRYGSLIVTGKDSIHVVEVNAEDIVQDGHH